MLFLDFRAIAVLLAIKAMAIVLDPTPFRTRFIRHRIPYQGQVYLKAFGYS